MNNPLLPFIIIIILRIRILLHILVRFGILLHIFVLFVRFGVMRVIRAFALYVATFRQSRR